MKPSSGSSRGGATGTNWITRQAPVVRASEFRTHPKWSRWRKNNQTSMARRAGTWADA